MSMIRSFVLADFITLGNAGFGMAAIFLCLNHVTDSRAAYTWAVFILLPLALICDVLDGFVAHRLKRQSILGADIVSFGVAPAVLGFALGLQGMWDALI
ncbi:MAG: hypothetical protein AUK27_06440 [Deltaproteobacteria bacterium CG2_30_66_27]|nr:MAG: hypothetical protein AUK27_06440 [Deltaproteobacteria bacterium CG2_30_66_27]